MFSLRHPSHRRLQNFVWEPPRDSARRTRAIIARHLMSCDECRREIAFLRRIQEDARSEPVPALPPALLNRILEDRSSGSRVLLPLTDFEQSSSRGSNYWRAAIVAVVLLSVAGVTLARWRDSHLSRRTATVVSNTEIPGQTDAASSVFTLGLFPSVAYAAPAQTAHRVNAITIDASRAVAGRWTYRQIDEGKGDARLGGVVRLQRTVWNKMPAWSITHSWNDGTTMLDRSAIISADEFAPMRRILHVPGRFVVTQTFVGDSMIGSVRTDRPGGASRVFRRQLRHEDGPYIAPEGFAVLVFRSIPLEKNWSGRIGLVGWGINPGDTYQTLEVHVIDRERIHVPAGTFDCWRLSVRVPHGPQTVWVRASDGLAIKSSGVLSNGRRRDVVVVSEDK